MNSLKLLRGTDIIGVITEPEQEGPEVIGSLIFTQEATKWKTLLDYMMADRDSFDDPPIELNIFEDWYVIDEGGVKRGIFAPCIYDGGTNLSWRWK